MVICPGIEIWMTPPQLHISLELLLRAGMFFTSTVGQPGAHGADVIGMHGIGVNTPNAAAVAEATVGFAIDWHMPNGIMFAIGLLSIIFAIGIEVITILSGSTIRELGATPKLHCIMAPPHTNCPISIPLYCTRIRVPFLLVNSHNQSYYKTPKYSSIERNRNWITDRKA
jgi:hypothetical protein